MSKILIAGGSGLLGSHLTNLLAAQKVSFVSTYFTKISNLKLKKFYIKCNLLNLSDCLKVTKNIKLAIFCSASKHAGISNLKKKSLYSENLNNIIMRLNFLEACKINKIKKIIWLSSSTAYQISKKKIKEDQMNYNKPVYEIYSGVGRVYRFIEQIAEYYREKFNMNIVTLRTSYIYGEYDNYKNGQGHVVPSLLYKANNKSKFLDVWGNPNVTRDFVYAGDLARACLKLLRLNKKINVINFSSDNGVTIYNLSKKILKITNKNKKIIFQNKKLSSAPYRVLNNNYFNKLFTKFKRTPLEKGLFLTNQWFKENYFK